MASPYTAVIRLWCRTNASESTGTMIHCSKGSSPMPKTMGMAGP